MRVELVPLRNVGRHLIDYVHAMEYD
jgi:hypothetical protein